MGRKGEVNCRNIKLREFDVKIKADMIEEKGKLRSGLAPMLLQEAVRLGTAVSQRIRYREARNSENGERIND